MKQLFIAYAGNLGQLQFYSLVKIFINKSGSNTLKFQNKGEKQIKKLINQINQIRFLKL